MTLASSLRNTYGFEHADSPEGMGIDDAVTQAMAESFEHLAIGETIPPSLGRFAGLAVMRNAVGMYIARTEASSPFQHGFTDAVTVSATGLARIAQLPPHTPLAEALDAIDNEPLPESDQTRVEVATRNATMSVVERQTNPDEALELHLDWSSQFPLLDRIRSAADQPISWNSEAEYDYGYRGGLYFWPAVLSSYALGEELREQFGDVWTGGL